MSVTREQVVATARLCRLDLSLDSGGGNPEEKLGRIASQMNAIVGYMDILNQVDTEEVTPLYLPLQRPEPPRRDVPETRRSADDMLANAPERKQNFFVVPPVI